MARTLATAVEYLIGNAREQQASMSEDPDSIEFRVKECDWSQNFS